MSQFIKHTSCDKCGSSDNFALYRDDEGYESGFCFGCNFTIPSKEWLEENSDDKSSKIKSKSRVKDYMQQDDIKVKPSTKPALTPEENQEIKSETSAGGNNFRGIRDDIYKVFGVRHSFSEEDGSVLEQYYPITQEGQLVGYKVREVPKNFYSRGRTGADCELFMQFKFNRGGKYLLITEGEIDSLSAYQMLKDYNVSKGSDFETAVVSPTTGAQSKKQIAAQYKFCDSFDICVLAFDKDKAGQEAAEEVLKYLPKGKVRLMQMRYKDANEYLEQGKQREFISDFYSAKAYVPAGVVGSSELYEKMLENAVVEKIPLPPFMQKLDNMLGSIELGTIGIFGAGSGSAKTTVANELLYFLLFHSPHKVGVVSLELTCAQYGQAMLSRHIENKISLIKDPQEKLKFLQQERVKNKAEELFLDENGNNRFMLIDERDGSVEVLQDKIEELIISCGCKVIILDPVSDIFDSLTIDEQAKFMKWCKSMIKNYNVTMILIAHIRKSGNNKDAASTGAFIPEESIAGSSTSFKSASWVVMMMRDKYNDDPIIRNTTRLILSKNRAGGETGDAGSLYYCNKTHKLHDLDEWVQEHGVTEF